MPVTLALRLSTFKKIHPAKLILFSYLVFIGMGTSLLLLPSSTVPEGISFIDALFTATSAACVTGLTVVDTGSRFSFSGQIIILVLIQLGGLGIMTFSVTFFLSIGKRVSFRQRMIMQETFAHTPREDIYPLVRSIFLFTGIVELLGTVLLFVYWFQNYSFFKALYVATFHSVSAFCNAGFSLFSNSFVDHTTSLLLNLTICALIILGGIGFPVAYEISQRVAKRSQSPLLPRVTVQTKTVLLTTLVLIFIGMSLFFWTEYDNVLKGYSLGHQLLISFFQSVTPRTAGFNTVDMAALSNATLILMMFFMFIGASPGSCGGGVKTTALAVLGAFTWARIRRRVHVNMFKKSLPHEAVTKSISLMILSISFIAVAFFLLLLSCQEDPALQKGRGIFVEYLFEVISAFGTVGLSMGATAKLSTWGKWLIILMMLIGRVGVFTFAYVVAGPESKSGIHYAEQNLMIG